MDVTASFSDGGGKGGFVQLLEEATAMARPRTYIHRFVWQWRQWLLRWAAVLVIASAGGSIDGYFGKLKHQ